MEILARECGIRLAVRGDSEVGSGEIEGEPVLLARPLTYMNRSGEAVAPLLRRAGRPPGDLIVVHDDLDLPPGRVRLKRGGGTGGHNGLRSLLAALGTADFVRVRVGIGRPPEGVDAADYVLSRVPPDIAPAFEGGVAGAASAVRDLLRYGFEKAATRWNARRPPPPARGGEA